MVPGECPATSPTPTDAAATAVAVGRVVCRTSCTSNGAAAGSVPLKLAETSSTFNSEVEGAKSCTSVRVVLAVSEVDHLGTSLFDVSVNPVDGKIWVPNTEARNFVRFEHPLGVQGHVVDNRLTRVDPSDGYSATAIDLNAHVDRASDPSTNLSERMASVSQPGMMAWNAAGTTAWLTAIGSRLAA